MHSLERAVLFGVPIDLLTMKQTIALIRNAMVSRHQLHHVALNVAKLITIQSNEELRADVLASDIISIDGFGILLAARLLGVPAPERVAGVDLMMEVLALCEREGFRPYFLGATASVLNAALSEALRRWPRLVIAGAHDGYFDHVEEAGVVENIRNSNADCLFVAISSPIKERFCHAHRAILNVPFIMGVGGSFDILAGKISRAPLFLQKNGLEWLFRLWQEPRRMWRRYVFTNIIFAGLLLKALLVRSRCAVFSHTIRTDR